MCFLANKVTDNKFSNTLNIIIMRPKLGFINYAKSLLRFRLSLFFGCLVFFFFRDFFPTFLFIFFYFQGKQTDNNIVAMIIYMSELLYPSLRGTRSHHYYLYHNFSFSNNGIHIQKASKRQKK